MLKVAEQLSGLEGGVKGQLALQVLWEGVKVNLKSTHSIWISIQPQGSEGLGTQHIEHI